jgi:hypothetical protein
MQIFLRNRNEKSEDVLRLTAQNMARTNKHKSLSAVSAVPNLWTGPFLKSIFSGQMKLKFIFWRGKGRPYLGKRNTL